MKCGGKGAGGQVKKAIVGLGCAAFLQGAFLGGTAIDCEAKADDTEEEVIEFVTAYQEAQTSEGIETLADYVAEPESQDFQWLLLNLRMSCEYGLVGYENIDVNVYPLSDGEHWLAFLSADWVIQGFDVTLPGMRSELVGRDQDGELRIETYSGSDKGLDSFFGEIKEISLLDETVDRNVETATRYNEVCADNPDIVEWVMGVSEKAVKARVDAEDQVIEASMKEEAAEEKPDKGGSRYVVKRGDCLWSIAEEQLGDGMLWSGLYEANRDAVGENPDLLYVGIELNLP